MIESPPRVLCSNRLPVQYNLLCLIGRAWVDSVVPIIREGKGSAGHFGTVEVMLKRGDAFAREAFSRDKLGSGESHFYLWRSWQVYGSLT